MLSYLMRDIIMKNNREKVYKEIYEEVENKYKDYEIDITLDIDISD